MVEQHTDQTDRQVVTEEEEEVYTVDEVAQKLRISRTLCYLAIKRGDIPSIHIGNRSIRVPKAALQRWLASGARLTTLALVAINGLDHF